MLSNERHALRDNNNAASCCVLVTLLRRYVGPATVRTRSKHGRNSSDVPEDVLRGRVRVDLNAISIMNDSSALAQLMLGACCEGWRCVCGYRDDLRVFLVRACACSGIVAVVCLPLTAHWFVPHYDAFRLHPYFSPRNLPPVHSHGGAGDRGTGPGCASQPLPPAPPHPRRHCRQRTTIGPRPRQVRSTLWGHGWAATACMCLVREKVVFLSTSHC